MQILQLVYPWLRMTKRSIDSLALAHDDERSIASLTLPQDDAASLDSLTIARDREAIQEGGQAPADGGANVPAKGRTPAVDRQGRPTGDVVRRMGAQSFRPRVGCFFIYVVCFLARLAPPAAVG